MPASPLLYFCDESHTRGHDYLGIGALAILPSRAAAIERDIAAINAAMNVRSEIKWETARERRDDANIAYLDLMASLVRHQQAHLHLRFSPIGEYDHSASGPRKHADTVSKAFYQILLHRAGRYYSRKCQIHVRPDNGSCTSYLPKMITGLNTDTCLSYGATGEPFSTIQPSDSVKEPLLQLLDITLGALTCARNSNHLNGGVGAYKAKFARHTLQALAIGDIGHSTSVTIRNLNVWNVRPKWKKGRGPEVLA